MVQLPLPAGEYWPTPQSVHVSCPLLEYRPAVHCAHCDWAGSDVARPAGHEKHAAVGTSAYVVAAQSAHAVAPLTANWPSAHVVHAAPPTLYRPAVHDVQLTAPVVVVDVAPS